MIIEKGNSQGTTQRYKCGVRCLLRNYQGNSSGIKLPETRVSYPEYFKQDIPLAKWRIIRLEFL